MSYTTPPTYLDPAGDSGSPTSQLGVSINDSYNELYRLRDAFDTVASGDVTFTDFTLGNGTFDYRVHKVSGVEHHIGRITFGSTTAITSTAFATPAVSGAGGSVNSSVYHGGRAAFYDTSAGRYYIGGMRPIVQSFEDRVEWFAGSVGARITSTSPFTWATGDLLMWSMTFTSNNGVSTIR